MRRLITATLLLVPSLLLAQEICDNGIDDDGDGLIDLNDPDCACATVIIPADVESYIPNPSFEDTLCCPITFSFGPYNALMCAQTWHQATMATSDYYHECGFFPATLPLPPPDGVACAGFIATADYKEYLGACLTPDILQAGVQYTLSLHIAGFSLSNVGIAPTGIHNNGVYYEGALPLTIFGLPACVPFPVPTFGGCVGDMGWMVLGSMDYVPHGGWDQVSITFTPSVDIATVMIGPGCDTPETFTSAPGPPMDIIYHPYFLVDDLTLTEAVDQVLTPVTSTGNVCAGNVVVTASPPAGATGHQWYLDGVAIVGQTGTSLNASALGLGAGTYTLASTFEGQCLMGSTNVAPPIVPAPAFTIAPAAGCAPLTVAFADITGPMSASSSWSFGDGGTGTSAATSHTYTVPGTYDVTLAIVTPAGCTADSTLIGAVTVHPDPVGTITATPNPTDVQNTTVALSGSSSTGGVVSWWWDLGDVPPHTSAEGSLTVTFPAVPGSYPVVLVVQNANGCVDTVHTVVTVLAGGEIEMPNVFSPNGDGHNDLFIPLDWTGTPGHLEIYNRWGQLLFSTDALAQGWDGRAAGSAVPAGTYYYILTPREGIGEARTGHITLIR